jgi:hypothetical protein
MPSLAEAGSVRTDLEPRHEIAGYVSRRLMAL